MFPRENLVGGSRRGKNLSELLSPTVQSAAPRGGPAPGDGTDDDVGGAAGGTDVRRNGSYHCDRRSSREDLPSMEETSTYLHHRKRNSNGLSMVLMIQPARSIMLEVHLM